MPRIEALAARRVGEVFGTSRPISDGEAFLSTQAAELDLPLTRWGPADASAHDAAAYCPARHGLEHVLPPHAPRGAAGT